MTRAIDGLARLLDTVDHLRVTVAARPGGGPHVPCRRLVDDPDFLLAVIRSTAPERRTERDDVAASLFVQSYAYRLATIAVGLWLIDGTIVDTTPDRLSMTIERARPYAVHFDELRTLPGDSITALHQTLIDDHIEPFLANVKNAVRVGSALLWGNVTSSMVTAFRSLPTPDVSTTHELRHALETFLSTGRPEIAAGGRIVDLGPTWVWERSSCCLFYKTETGSMCQDCSLRTDDERQARYQRVLAADVGPE